MRPPCLTPGAKAPLSYASGRAKAKALAYLEAPEPKDSDYLEAQRRNASP
jgi:hypothetical protein